MGEEKPTNMAKKKDKPTIVTFRLNRYEDEGGTSDVAIVTASTDDGVLVPDTIMERVAKAVARWIENTDEGKKLWEETNGDLNIADIAGVESSDFTLELLRAGINGFAVQINPAIEPEATRFSFDTVLPLRVKDFVEPE
jgi:citrate lyase beta subunit